MFKNRSILVIAALSLLLVTMAVSRSFSSDPTPKDLSGPSGLVNVPVTGGQDAHDMFCQEELTLYDCPTASSLGKAIRELRQEELSLNDRQTASPPGSAAFYEYQLGEFRREELCNRSENSSLGGAGFHEYCRGE